MAEVEGARTFHTSGEAYDRFMGRYSRALAPVFADFCRLEPGLRFLDVGCGPGALAAVAAERLGASAVMAVDPSPDFVDACRARLPGVAVSVGRIEELPYPDDDVDCAAAQLVFHFVTDPGRGAGQLARVVRPGGVVAATVWDFADGMELLRSFWDAALRLDADAPDEARTLRFGRAGELTDLFTAAGLVEVEETTLSVESRYSGFAEVWTGFLAGIGPAGSYATALPADQQERLRAELEAQLGWSGSGPFTLHAVARAARARVPAP